MVTGVGGLTGVMGEGGFARWVLDRGLDERGD